MPRGVPPQLVDIKPWDWPTLWLRPLPTFLLAGVGKSGTTSLYTLLEQHPETVSSRKKAPHFFNKRFKKGIHWYRRQFPVMAPPSWIRITGSRPPLVFEASASYFTSPTVPERVAKLLPGVKIAVILRSPIDRAVSQYQHNIRRGRETLSFDEAIQRELTQDTGPEPDRDPMYFSFAYLRRGRYVEHMREWLKFLPHERFMTIKAEDYYQNPRPVFGQLLEFLDLSPWAPYNFEVQNAGGAYPTIASSTRDFLQSYFKPYNLTLYDILGRDFGW